MTVSYTDVVAYNKRYDICLSTIDSATIVEYCSKSSKRFKQFCAQCTDDTYKNTFNTITQHVTTWTESYCLQHEWFESLEDDEKVYLVLLGYES